jgi:tubulin-specific chaperone E
MGLARYSKQKVRLSADFSDSGNRWQTVLPDEVSHKAASAAFQNVKELALDETLLDWHEISLIASTPHELQELSASTNQLSVLLPSNPLPDTLTTLVLEYNDFSSLSDLLGISTLQNLRNLHLKGNNISSVGSSASSNKGVAPSFPASLRYLDLSYNQVATWSFVDALQQCFPGMTSLRFAHNPIYDNPDSSTAAFLQAPTTTEAPHAGKSNTAATEEAYMLTIGRLPTLQSLNFSTVTATDRLNAETFYLGRIVRQLASVPANSPAEGDILASHPRWKELCDIYGEPDVVRRSETNPAFLEARLIKVAFYLASDAGSERAKIMEIPKSFDIYKVKSIVGIAFRHSPRKLRLVWETGEWDPVAGFDDAKSDSSDDESGDAEEVHRAKQLAASGTLDPEQTKGHSGRWVKREVEISDGPRQFGFCVDGPNAKIRVELLE